MSHQLRNCCWQTDCHKAFNCKQSTFESVLWQRTIQTCWWWIFFFTMYGGPTFHWKYESAKRSVNILRNIPRGLLKSNWDVQQICHKVHVHGAIISLFKLSDLLELLLFQGFIPGMGLILLEASYVKESWGVGKHFLRLTRMVSLHLKSGYNRATHIKYHCCNWVVSLPVVPVKDAHFQGERYELWDVRRTSMCKRKIFLYD